jgi:GST-like protein
LDRQLSDEEYVAGDYSIADMAIFPWCRLHERQRQRQRIEDFPNVQRWFKTVAARPAVARDMKVTEDKAGKFDKESWSNLFGTEQYKRRG